MSTYQYAIPKDGCKVGDIVVADHSGNGSSEWVGRVSRVTKATVTVHRLKTTIITEYFSGTDAADTRVLAEPQEDEGSSYLFRWAKAAECYQTTGGGYRLVRHYEPGSKLVFQAYY